MKTPRFLLLLILALAIALVLSRRSTAQSAAPKDDAGPPGRYEQLVLALSKRGDTNTVAEIVRLVNSIHAEQHALDIGVAVNLLDNLRSGRTNDAIRLLETRLDGSLIAYGAAPASDRDPKYNPILKRARDYRTKYPHKSGMPEIDASITRTLNSIPK